MAGLETAGTTSRGRIHRGFEASLGDGTDILSAIDYVPNLDSTDLDMLRARDPSSSRVAFFNVDRVMDGGEG